jgi:hypothetical protein
MSQGNGQDDAMSDSYCVEAAADSTSEVDCDGPVPRRRSMVGGVLRHRRGSSKYYDSVAQLPDGPVDREAFGNWPRRLMADLFNGQPLRCKRAESFIELGEVLHTDFSGVGGSYCRSLVLDLQMSRSVSAGELVIFHQVAFVSWQIQSTTRFMCFSP